MHTIRPGRLDPHCLGFCRDLQLQQTERKRGERRKARKPWKNKDSLGTSGERNKIDVS